MLDFVKRMVDEHSQLVVRTQKLNEYIYSDKSNKDDKVEFANKCLQLSAMKKYEEALRARLENAGIMFEEGQYFEKVASITPTIVPPVNTTGSDYDIDKKPNINQNEE